jgi:hypothetical protein
MYRMYGTDRSSLLFIGLLAVLLVIVFYVYLYPVVSKYQLVFVNYKFVIFTVKCCSCLDKQINFAYDQDICICFAKIFVS